MYYNIDLFVVIAFKSMMIYNTKLTRCIKLQWIVFLIVTMYYKSHILPLLILLYLKTTKTTYKY